ncbi:MAG: phytoene/squalene synthase family protein [Ignavibacteria bacterium]
MKYDLNIIPDFLKGTYSEYKDYTKYYAKSFYFSSFALPKEKRNAAYAVYAFCRYADNITDISKYESPEFLESKINFLLEILDEVYKHVNDGSKYISDFTLTVKKFNIPKEYFRELIDGVASDIHKKVYYNFEELDVYCYKVASVVGLIMTKIMGYSNDNALEHAVHLGKAMQLTNILRDVADDYSMGRIYLPKEELDRFNYTEDDIKNKIIDERFYAMMKFQINRAREYYNLAEKGFKYLPNDGSRSTVKMMSRIYSGILSEIENNNYDVYSKRHYVSTFSKVMMTMKIFSDKRSSKGKAAIKSGSKPAVNLES